MSSTEAADDPFSLRQPANPDAVPSRTSFASPELAKEPTGITKEGWLEKLGGIRKNWKRRYFVLKDNELKYYKTSTDKDKNKKPQGKINLEGSSVEIAAEEKHGKKFCFELHTPLNKRVYVLVAESATPMQDWLSEIRKAMLRIRRAKSKTVPERKVTLLLREQEEKALRKISDEPTTRNYNPPNDRLSSPELTPYDDLPPNGYPSTDQEPEHQRYMSWLQETKSHQRRGTITERNHGYSMTQRLLDDDQPRQPFFQTHCCRCQCAVM